MPSIELLLDAIRNRDSDAARALLEAEPALALARGENGDSPVMTAIYHDAGAILAMLVARGAEVDVFAGAALGSVERLAERLEHDPEQVHAFSHDGWTPLHLAAFFGQTAAAELLIARGSDPGARSRNATGNTPLHAALAGHEQPALVHLLLAHGADVNARAALGVTPLHLAASRGNGDLVEALLERGATVDACMDDGTTPAAMAASRGHPEVAGSLQRRAAAPLPA
jgi:uncharacterized protein